MTKHSSFLLSVGSLAALTAFSALPASAQKVDPDPDIFDGTIAGGRGGNGNQIQQSTIDLGNWEESSVVVYGPDGQNPQPFSVGVEGLPMPTTGGGGMGGPQGNGIQMPGMQGGSQGMQIPGLSIPLPMGGGGNSEQSSGGQQSMSQAGQQGGQQPPPGMQGNSGDGQGGQGQMPPENVAIGDPDNTIQSEGPPPVDGTAMTESGGNQGSQGRAGNDRTKVKAASGAQSGTRGGGVETGDAMPTDL